jgi:hypothetical protein
MNVKNKVFKLKAGKNIINSPYAKNFENLF